MTEWVDAAWQAAEILGPEVVKTGARWTGRHILGTPAERGIEGIYQRAIAGLLVEIGEDDEDTETAPDPEAVKVAETVLGSLCSDDEAAGLLLNVALRPGPVPVAELRDRAAWLGYEPDTLPFVFDGAMRVLTDKVWEEFLEEAGEENSSIQGLVNAELLASVREHHQALRETRSAASGSLLPPPPGLVLGRAEEIRIIKQALGIGDRRETESDGEANAPARRIAAIHGWPGVGKSTFVAALCGDRELRNHFSGGVIFVSVGRSPEVRRLAEEVCVALGTPAPPGTALDTLRRRIAEVLSRISVLLVFDDVWEERHVSPLLLAGGGSAALVATRRLDVAARLSTSAEAPLKLGLLDEEDSLKLIASRASGVVAENVGACRDLVRALDGLPLALRVAADLLRVESEAGFDVSGLLDELTGAARILDEGAPHDTGNGSQDGAAGAATTVRSLLRRSIERLDEDAVRHFARLGILPPKPLSFDLWAAQEVWRDTSENPPQGDADQEDDAVGERIRTRRVLGDLVRRGLVESAGVGIDPLAVKLDLRPERPERFWMHALVSAFALETLGRTEEESGVREAQQRRLEHYRRVVGAASEALRQGGETQYFGVFLMSLDLPNIRAAHDWARERSSYDRRALEYLSHLLSEGSRVLSDRLSPSEFLDWTTLAEKAAREIGDENDARSHREVIGAALLKKGQLREALVYCEDSREVAHQSGDAVAEATALANLASIRNSMGEHETALGLARRAEAKLGDVHAPDILAGAIGQQADALEGLERLPEAEERYEARRDLARREGMLAYYARALKGIAGIKRERPEERDKARCLYEEAAQVSWDLEDYADYRAALNGLGVLELKANALDTAENAFLRVLSSAVDDDHKGDQARAKMNIGITHQDRETREGYQAAEAEYREALPLARSWDEPDLLGDVAFNLAHLLFYLGRPRDARTEAISAAEAYGRAGSAKESWARDLISKIANAND